jgi:hypothetical protein
MFQAPWVPAETELANKWSRHSVPRKRSMGNLCIRRPPVHLRRDKRFLQRRFPEWMASISVISTQNYCKCLLVYTLTLVRKILTQCLCHVTLCLCVPLNEHEGFHSTKWLFSVLSQRICNVLSRLIHEGFRWWSRLKLLIDLEASTIVAYLESDILQWSIHTRFTLRPMLPFENNNWNLVASWRSPQWLFPIVGPRSTW